MGGKKRGQLTVFDGTNKESGGKKEAAWSLADEKCDP